MATFSKEILSGSVDGAPITIDNAQTTIHVTPTGTASKDEIYVYATNNAEEAVMLTLTFGEKEITNTLDSKTGLYLLIPGLILQNGKEVIASASATNAIEVCGFVNRIFA